MGDRSILTSEENRAAPRKIVSWRARVATGGRNVVEGRTFDVSSGGAGLLCASALPNGAVVLVELQVLSADPHGETQVVTCKAKLVFQVLSGDDYRCGVQWVEPSLTFKKALSPWL